MIDSLPRSPSGLWLGVDGGGSKTDFQLVSSGGRVLGAATLGGINRNYCSEADVVAMLEEGRNRVYASAGVETRISPGGTIMCMAGFGVEFFERFKGLRGFGEVFSAGDHLPMLELCGGDGSCLIVHSGTGSFVSGRLAEDPAIYWGGYGYILIDPGSGADIGRRAVRRAFEECSGVAPKTDFGERIRDFYGFRDYDHVVEVVYGSASPARIMAECVPLVVRMLEEGDRLAVEIVRGALAELAELAERVAGEFSAWPCRRGLSGGVLTVPSVAELMRRELETRGLPGPWIPLREKPIEGVRRMLLKWARGVHPDRVAGEPRQGLSRLRESPGRVFAKSASDSGSFDKRAAD
jgi:N-acetylglucosamine kinase-like BadF-type ATPase